MTANFKSGFVSLLGRPNTGKSTLLNALVGTKLAIVADKPQTTRTSVQGVLTLPEAQIVFVDTPGIHRADSLYQKRMMRVVRGALEERDLLLYLADARRGIIAEDRHAVDMLRKAQTPSILALNKIDLVKDKRRLLERIEQYKSVYEFDDYVPLSALTGDGLDVLRKVILERLPAGPAYFPADHITDQPERFLAAELVREKILHLTREEVPHAVAVRVDGWEESEKLIKIYASIYVEREGHKGIVIGNRGAMLKQIGTLAREEMERFFGKRIFLDLRVKVQPGWREKPAFLDALDWRTMALKDDT